MNNECNNQNDIVLTKDEIKKKWMFCIGNIDMLLNSPIGCTLHDEVFCILNDVLLDLEVLMAFYENETIEPKTGNA